MPSGLMLWTKLWAARVCSLAAPVALVHFLPPGAGGVDARMFGLGEWPRPVVPPAPNGIPDSLSR